MRKESILILLIGILSLPGYVVAQDVPTIPLEKFYVDRKDRLFRKLLRNFRFSFSTGAGKTYFKHKLDSMGIFQSPTEGPYLFGGNQIPTRGYFQWIDSDIDTVVNAATGFLVSSDTADLGFKSKAFTIPIKLTIHYEFKNFRLGVGYSKDFIFLKPFTPISFGDTLRSVSASVGSVSTSKWFLVGGYSFYRIDKFLFTGDLQFGTNKFSKKFDGSIIKPSPFFNLGVTVEREMSEYLRLFIRPSFEFKSYTITLPETNHTVKHRSNSLLWNVGITYSIPELPRCRLRQCQIQINHAHGNKEYRSRMHPIWKKQNPGYGENNPKLIKFKWRNRKKINAY